MANRIMVVEDEPDTRDLRDFTLRWSGHHVDAVEGGREALELLALYSYDVILTTYTCGECPVKISTVGSNTGGPISRLASCS